MDCLCAQFNWQQLINAAATVNNIDLLAEGWYSPLQTNPTQMFNYFVYAAAATVVEIDVLTGELEVRQNSFCYNVLSAVGSSGCAVVRADPVHGACVRLWRVVESVD